MLRLYDAIEAERSYQTGERHVLLVLDEGDPALVDADDERRRRGVRAAADASTTALVDRWLEHRNDVRRARGADPARASSSTRWRSPGRWADLAAIYDVGRSTAIGAVEATLAVSAHQSHTYPDGACLYFTFAGQARARRARTSYYRAAWDAGTRAVLADGGALSHHHGVGLNRARFVAEALGRRPSTSWSTLKAALDPNGILNPGKLGLPSPFGEVSWPT